jgi:voltage-gated potassium channel
METLTVQPGSLLENKQIGELEFEKRKLTLVGVISSNKKHLKHPNRYKLKNQHFYFNPQKQFELQEQDIVVVLGREYTIEHFQDQIEKSRLAPGK